jgi:hypothetical protein
MQPAPYVPFKTFLAALESLEKGLPGQVDRSLWPSYSGAIQGQLLGALRFLGLIDEAHAPTPELADLATRPEARRALLRKLLERSYSTLAGIDLSRASPRQFEEAMRQYGLTGATHRKSVSFFLQAAQYAGLPLSPLLKQRTRTAAAGHRRPVSAEAPRPMSRTVHLRGGGVLTLTAAVDVFSLSEEDRALVFDLVDRLQAYEKSGP